MSDFTKLIQAASDDGRPLSGVLLKAQVLAAQLPSRSFRQWVQWEVNGYRERSQLPDYRVLPTTLWGNYVGPFNSRAWDVSISTLHLPSDMRAIFDEQPMFDGVSYIEDLVSQSGNIGRNLEGELVNYLRSHGPWITGLTLNEVQKRISRHSLVTLLTSARSRLLEFLLTLRNKYPALDTDDSAAARVNAGEVEAVAQQKVLHNCTVIEVGDMRDMYQAGQAENMSFIQVLRGAIGDSSLAALAGELERVRAEMAGQSKTAEQDAAVAAVAQAEDAAKKGDAQGVLAYLKSAGRWAMDVATGIGSSVATKAIEAAMGL
jgi:AbiTii